MTSQPNPTVDFDVLERLGARPHIGKVEYSEGAVRVWARQEDLRVRRTDSGLVLGALVDEHLTQWSEVYDLTYSGSVSDPDLDLSGWRSSDSGEPFPRAQMAEWADRTVELILKTEPRIVVEVGCGTGILLHRLLPHIDRYVGLDVAGEVISRHREANLPGAVFCHAAAHDLHTPAVADALVELGPIDTVVLNSVTQCFGSVDYLTAVVHDMISVVRPGGSVLVGDIRHSGLSNQFAQWLARSAGEKIRTSSAEDTEMLIDPATLAQIAAGAPQRTRLVTLPKTMSFDNELSRYRFDAVFRVVENDDEAPPSEEIVWRPNALLSDAANAQTPAELRTRNAVSEIVVLHPDDPESIGVARSLDAGAYTAEHVTARAQSHEPLGAFIRRKLTEECRREFRRAGLPPLDVSVELPSLAPASQIGSATIVETWDAAGLATVEGTTPSLWATAVDELNQIALQTVSQFLLQRSPLGDGPATVDEVCSALDVAQRHVWVVRGWLKMLASHGRADLVDDRFALRAVPVRADLFPDGPLLDRACSWLGYSPQMASFFRTALQNFGDLVADRVSTASIMFTDGDLASMGHNDRGNVGNRYVRGALRAVATDVVSRSSGPLSVVELGGGSGGATSAVVDGLGEAAVDCLFADVSSAFVEPVPGRLPGLEFAVADINHNLLSQGLGEDKDMVVAADVLHRSISIGSSLRWIRDLTGPQGCLLVAESVRERPIMAATLHFMLSGRDGAPQVGSGDRRADTDRVCMPLSALRAELAEAGWTIRWELPPAGSPLKSLGQVLLACTPTPAPLM